MQKLRFIILFIAFIAASSMSAARFTIAVVEAENRNKAIEFAGVVLTRGDVHLGGLTDVDGRYVTEVAAGEWSMTVSAVGYIRHRL